MNEFIIPLSWDRLDPMLESVERCLEQQMIPTVLRLRTQMVLEEFFSAAIAAPGADTAILRCTLPAPRTVLIQCRSSQPDFAPDWDGLRALENSDCTYGLKLALTEDCCRIMVGQK